jgi:PAS domain S-box-containing protein
LEAFLLITERGYILLPRKKALRGIGIRRIQTIWERQMRPPSYDFKNPLMVLNLLAYLLVFIVFPMSFFTACHQNPTEKNPPEAVKGVLDLSEWDLEKDGPVNLLGEYAFYWHQHVTPLKFREVSPPKESGFIKVTGYWSRDQLEGKRLPGDGFATYHLKILLRDKMEPLALKFLSIGTAFNAYLDGKEISSVGVPGQDRQTTVPRYFPHVVDLIPEKNQVDLILHVSNFHHRRGGVWEVIKLGTEKQIREIRERRLTFDLFLFGSILIMGLYHLGLFTLRRKDRSPLYFSIFCFVVAVRLLVTGERYLVYLFPDTNWEILIRLEFLTVYLAVPVFTLFMRSLFEEFSKHILYLFLVLGFALSCSVLVTPPRIFTHALPMAQISIVTAFLYGAYVLVVACIRKRDGALAFLIGFMILSLTAVNDILHVEKIIETQFLAPFGLFAFILSQAFLLSLRFSKAISTVETQRKELRETLEAYKREIIDRLRAEDALRDSEEKYRTILHSIEDGYYEVDLKGNLTFFNDSLCNILGYPKDDLMGMNYSQFVSKGTSQGVYDSFNQVLRTGKPAKAFDWETIRKDGTTRLLQNSVSLMRDADGEAFGFRGVVRDITELRQAEEQAKLHQQQLMQADKMVALGTLVSGVAHEINNPNNFIMLNSPILKEAWENAVPILEKYYEENGDFILGGMKYSDMRKNIPKLFSGISAGATRIKQIIEDLKKYVRKDTADMTQSVDINEVSKSATSLLSTMIKKSTHYFSVEYGENLPVLKGNSQRLEQVMVNLIQNACHALPDPSKGITVSTAYDPKNGHIVFRIQDEGEGIPSEILPHITDPFVSTKLDSGGVGLGLSVSSTIVKEHGGEMHFRSEPGKGTTAEVVLPVTRDNKRQKGM